VSRDKTPLHKVAAWSLLFCTLVHVAAHLYNYSQYHAAATAVWEKSVLGKESGLDPQPAYWEVRRGAMWGLLARLRMDAYRASLLGCVWMRMDAYRACSLGCVWMC
jgi:hypothetical protein